MNRLKIILLLSVLACVALFFGLDLDTYLRLDHLKAARADVEAYYRAHPLSTMVAFTLFYTLVSSLSIPGATVMTLFSGAMFGVFWGVVLTSFASVLGATIAFLFARYLLREAIQKRFAPYLVSFNNGIREEGGFYLFTLRLVPLFPYFIINLVMGLSHIKTFTFVWVSQLGMLPATIILVNAGTQLAHVEAIDELFSIRILGSLALLGIMPLLAKKSIDLYRRRHRSGETSNDETQ